MTEEGAASGSRAFHPNNNGLVPTREPAILLSMKIRRPSNFFRNLTATLLTAGMIANGYADETNTLERYAELTSDTSTLVVATHRPEYLGMALTVLRTGNFRTQAMKALRTMELASRVRGPMVLLFDTRNQRGTALLNIANPRDSIIDMSWIIGYKTGWHPSNVYRSGLNLGQMEPESSTGVRYWVPGGPQPIFLTCDETADMLAICNDQQENILLVSRLLERNINTLPQPSPQLKTNLFKNTLEQHHTTDDISFAFDLQALRESLPTQNIEYTSVASLAGFEQWETLVGSIKTQPESTECHARLQHLEPRTESHRLLAPPQKLSFLDAIPANATLAIDVPIFSPNQLWNAWRDYLIQYEFNGRENSMIQAEHSIEQTLGASINSTILPLIGDEAAIVFLDNRFSPSNAVIMIAVKDERLAQRLIDDSAIRHGAVPNASSHPSGTEYRHYHFPGEPNRQYHLWTQPGVLFLSVDEDALVSAIDTRTGIRPSLVSDHENDAWFTNNLQKSSGLLYYKWSPSPEQDNYNVIPPTLPITINLRSFEQETEIDIHAEGAPIVLLSNLYSVARRWRHRSSR